MRRPARLLPLIALLLLLAIGTLVLLRTGPLANYVRALIATELSKQLDRDVTIAGAGVTSSGEIALDDLLVRNEDGTSLLRVPRVSVRMGTGRGFLSLFSGATEIRSVRLVDPELALTRLPDGKLSVSDLLERPREAPSRFRGSVEVEGGKITLVDQASDGLTTSLSDVRVSFAYPRPDTAVFAVECGRNDGILDSLELQGERSTESGETRVQFLAKGVVAPYVLERLPESGLGDVSAGEADLKGEVSFGSEHGALSYDVLMQLSQVEIAFPWLRQPVQQVEGEVRVRDGGVDLRRLVGTLADAPVTVDGSILSVDEPTLDLKITASGVRYRQIQALFPRVALPAALVLPSPLGVTADVKGPVTDIRVTGEARMSVIEFRAVPWHDLVMPFEYRRGRLRVSPSAHGSPRRFEAELEVDLLKPMPGGAGTVSVMNLPLEMLAAMAGIEGDFGGTVQAKVRGEVDGDRRFSGSVRVVDAVIQGAAIGELEGDFEYADDVLLFPELRLSGPVATGVLEAKYSRAGDYELRGSLTQLDLSAIGASVSLAALRGRCCAHLEASGHLGDGTAGGSVLLGPGEIQGRDFESLSATFSVSPTRAALAQLELRLGRGQCAGGIAVGGWKGPREQAEVSGRLEFSGFGLDEWLPPQVSVVAPSGRVSGSVELGGTLADPGVAVDLRLESLTGAGQAFDGGEIQARYDHGRLIVEKGRVGIADGDLFVTGGYAPETGFSLQLVSDNIQLEQLAAGWRTQLGLALTGTLAATASLTGPLERPKLAVSLAARPLSLNQEQFDELVLDARFEGSTFGIDSFELQQGESSVSLFGTFDTEDESVVAELKLTELDIGALAMIANSAIYRLDRTRGDRPRPRFVQSYARVVSHLTRRPKGSLSAVVSVSGTIAEPQIEVASLAFDDAAFDGWRVDHVGGSLSISLGKRPSGAATLRRLEVDLESSYGSARASLVGGLSMDEEGELAFEATDLDLPLLASSLGPTRVGQATLTMTVVPLGASSRGQLGREVVRIGELIAIPRAALHLREVSLAPMAQMVPAKFDADLYLTGNRIEVYDEGADGARRPGVRGEMGPGAFLVDGDATIAHWDPGKWEESQFDVRLSLEGARLALPGVIDARIDGSVRLTRDHDTPGALLTTRRVGAVGHDPLVVSDAVLRVPKVKFGETRGKLFFSPTLDVVVLVGEDVQFRYGSERRPSEVKVKPGHLPEEGEPSGYLRVGGTASADGVELVGEFESREGVLAFPNGTLQLQQARAWVSREAGESPVVMINATAAGRVGDYYVSFRPSGQIVPYDADLVRLNATSIPPLEEGFVLALLGGTVVAQAAESKSDLARLLSDPTRAPGREGQIEGVMVPAFTSSSGSEVGFDVGTSGQVRLRLAQKLSDRFVVSYVDSLTGARGSYTLRFIYQITHLWSIGRAVDELEQGRWEVQAFIPF